jgi:hypothetical protein
MAKTTVKPSKDMQGASIADPTRANRPAAPTYKYPQTRGLPSLPDKDAPLTGYGRNGYAGPSSVGVTDSASMTDFSNLATPKNDAVLKSLQVNGHGDQSGENSAVADLQRKVDTSGYPASHGMRNRSHEGGTAPGSTAANEAPLPKRPN